MKTEIISRRRNNVASLIIIGVFLHSCAVPSNCDSPNIEIFRGIYFNAGTTMKVEFDNGEFQIHDDFKGRYKVIDYKLIGRFCCVSDSCRVVFSLNDVDTVFYISPSTTKRLMIGSNSQGGLVVATDINEIAWENL